MWKLVVQTETGTGKVREYNICPNDPGFTPDTVKVRYFWASNLDKEGSNYHWAGQLHTSSELPAGDISLDPNTKQPCHLSSGIDVNPEKT